MRRWHLVGRPREDSVHHLAAGAGEVEELLQALPQITHSREHRGTTQIRHLGARQANEPDRAPQCMHGTQCQARYSDSP